MADLTPANAPTGAERTQNVDDVMGKDVDWSDLDASGNLVEKEPAPSQPEPEPIAAPAIPEPEPAPKPEPVAAQHAAPPPSQPAAPPAPVEPPADDPVTKWLHPREKRPLKTSEVDKILTGELNAGEMRAEADRKYKAATELTRRAEAALAEAQTAFTERDTLKAQLSERTAREELAKLDPGDEPEPPDRDEFDSTNEGDAAYRAAVAEYKTAHREWKSKDRAFQAETIRRQIAPPAPPPSADPLAFMTSEDYPKKGAEAGQKWLAEHPDVTPEVFKAVAERVETQINARYTRGEPTPIAAFPALLDAAHEIETLRRELEEAKRTRTLTADAVARGEANQRAANERGQEVPAVLPGTAATAPVGRPDTDDGWTKLLMQNPEDENLATEYEAWLTKAIRIKDDKERVRVLGVAA